MKIQEIEFSRLIPADYNPRVALTPDMPEFERLKNSIETFGNVEPIVWNERTGHIVGGHQRLAVLQHLGYTSAEVSVVDLDEKEEKLLNVALNKIKGQWDYSRLEEIFQEYELEEAKVTGFTGQEIALILAKNDDVEDPAAWQDDEEDEEDEDPVFLRLDAHFPQQPGRPEVDRPHGLRRHCQGREENHRHQNGGVRHGLLCGNCELQEAGSLPDARLPR